MPPSSSDPAFTTPFNTFTQRLVILAALVSGNASPIHAAIIKAAAQPVLPTAQPDYARTAQILTDAGWANATSDVTVTLTGVDYDGNAQSHDYVIPAGSAAGFLLETAEVWSIISRITFTTPAGWTAGAFEVDMGVSFGYPSSPLEVPGAFGVPVSFVERALNAGVPVAGATLPPGTFQNRSYTPHTALGAPNGFLVEYQIRLP
jgi:hypothetical protein